MPTGNLPASAKTLYEKVYKRYRDKGMSEEEAAKRAWGAVKNAGYSKGEDGAWHKNAELAEFSLIVRSVGLNKETGERYWKASTSDIYPDSYNDEMSLDLYRSFLHRIEQNEAPPEQYRSESWQGGLPYVSVSHYREHSIAGDSEKVYIDGAILKANGTFRNTKLGRACFDALWDDLYVKNGEGDRIRVSIAFLDYKHKHKATGNIFVRSDINEVCPECVAEKRENRRPGKIFLDGLLVHFAMTRVPVNPRTLMEVKSMTTRKDDASSIVGEELAEELEVKERALVGKSEAEVIKSDEDGEESVERSMDDMEEEYRPFGGATTLADARAFIEAGKEQRRVGDIWYAFYTCLSNIASSDIEDKPKAIKELSDEFAALVKDKNAEIFESLVTLSMDSEPQTTQPAPQTSLETVLVKLEAVEQAIALAAQRIDAMASQTTSAPQETDSHPLGVQLAQLRSDFDTIAMMDGPAVERLRAIQSSFDALGDEIRRLLSVEPVEETPQAVVSNSDIMSEKLLNVLQNLSDKIDHLSSQQRSAVTPAPARGIPAPRSIAPAQVQQQQQVQRSTFQQKSPTPKLARLIAESVGLKE